MALVDVLNGLQLKWSVVSGSGVGKISAAYADGVFNLEEAALSVYHFASVLESGVTDVGKFLEVLLVVFVFLVDLF